MAGDRAHVTLVDGASAEAPSERSVTLSVTNAVLLLSLAVAATLRLWNIASVPPELHPDEYAGWIGVTDMLAGRNSPSVFLDYGVVYLPLYGFFEVLSVPVFGQTVTAFRVPAALFGTLTALATGLIAYQLVPKRAVLLLATAIMAVLPWDISASRIGWEPAAMLPFLLFGLYLLRRGLARDSGRDVVLGFVLLAAGAYSYRAESFYALGLTGLMLIIEWKRTRAMAHELWIGLGAALAIVGPLVLSVLAQPHLLTSGPAQGTFDGGINAATLDEFRRLYFLEFSVPALFVTGDGNLQHGPPVGVLYPWMLPFVVAGLFAPAHFFRPAARWFALGWLLLYPLGASLTDEAGGQHFIRTLAGAPLFCILAAIGLVASWEWLQSLGLLRGRPALAQALPTLLAAVAVVELAQFCVAYFVRYPDQAAHIFHYGDRDIFAFVKANDGADERVCFTSLDPWNYSAAVRYYMPGSTHALYSWVAPACRHPRSLLSLKSRSEAPAGARFLGTVQDRDGSIRAYFYAMP